MYYMCIACTVLVLRTDDVVCMPRGACALPYGQYDTFN